jgi:hypothetical protein
MKKKNAKSIYFKIRYSLFLVRYSQLWHSFALYNENSIMKKNNPTIDKDKLDPMKDTRNYAAGREGEDIIDKEDDELDEPLADEEILPGDEFDDEEDVETEDDPLADEDVLDQEGFEEET